MSRTEKYDFDYCPDRTGTGSIKWDSVEPGTIPLSIADMDVVSPPAVVKALTARSAHGVFGYTHDTNHIDVAVAWLKRRHNLSLQASWCSWTPGVVGGVNIALHAFVGSDAILMHSPAYSHFYTAIEDQGCQLVEIPLVAGSSGKWEMRASDVEAAVDAHPNAKALLLCNPHNPSGRCWTASELKMVGEVCVRRGLIIIVDEIWADFGLDREYTPFLEAYPEAANRTVLFTAASKTFNTAGMSCSLVVIPNAELRAAFEYASRDRPDVNLMGLEATRAAWGGECDDWVDQLMVHLRSNRGEVAAVLKRLPRLRWSVPEATYLFWIDARDAMPDGVTAKTLTKWLETNYKISLSDGTDFGAPGHVRINFGCPKAQIVEAMKRFEDAFSQSTLPRVPFEMPCVSEATNPTDQEMKQLAILRGVGLEDGSLHLYLLRKYGHDIEKVLLDLLNSRNVLQRK